MFPTIADGKRASGHGAWFWKKVACPLLALGFAGAGLAAASPNASQRPATVAPQQADAGPAMITFNGKLYVGWTGRNAAHNLNLMTYNTLTKVFSPAQVLTDNTLVGSGMNLAVLNNSLYVSWMGTDHRLNVARYNPADPTHLANKVTLREFSNQAPALVTFGPRMYLSWRGLDGRLNIISSADAHTFNTKVTYAIAIRTSPSLIAANVYLYIFWEDMSTSSHIVVGRYDPLHPATMGPVVTLASTSVLPVGLTGVGIPEPYVRVAWRTADDPHVRLGIFEGGPYLHNPVYTVETTPYGPSLALPGGPTYMGWTGTDKAQSVNVSPANI